MSSVIKSVGSLFSGQPKAVKGPSAADIAAQEAAQAAADQAKAEEEAKKRKAAQAAITGQTSGSGDATESLRATLLGGV